jgi:hypothetical protein
MAGSLVDAAELDLVEDGHHSQEDDDADGRDARHGALLKMGAALAKAALRRKACPG